MPDAYRVIIAPRASKQLQHIFDYFAKDSAQNAAKLIGLILLSIDNLDKMPHRFSLMRGVPSVGNDIRTMPVPPYLVHYQINEGNRTVRVLSIRHGARRPGI